MCKVFIYFHYSLSIKWEIDRRQLKFQILTLLIASSPQCETSRWRLPGIGAMAVLIKSIQIVCIGPDRVMPKKSKQSHTRDFQTRSKSSKDTEDKKNGSMSSLFLTKYKSPKI